MKLGIINLGCPKNTVDTEVMLTYLGGPNLVTDPRQADTILINTCGFLKASRLESEQAIADMLKVKKLNKNLKIIVAGCYVTKETAALKKRFKGIHSWVGVNDIANIKKASDKPGTYTGAPPFVYSGKDHAALLNPYSAYVKISEGCNHKCSFCAIPGIKGKYRSRPVNDIVKEVKTLVDAGVKEVNIISQDSSYYGSDIYGKRAIDKLLSAILKSVKKFFWLRVMYLYPELDVIKKIASVMKKERRLCRYFDIPFQHVNSALLTTMKRGHHKEDILAVIKYIRENMEGAVIRSSFITGYPGEDKDKFEELKGFISAGFVDKAGIFAYSDEPGTAAYKYKGKVRPSETRRRERILSLASKKVSTYNKQRERVKALVVGIDSTGAYIARTEAEAPDIDNYIYINTKKHLRAGKFYSIMV